MWFLVIGVAIGVMATMLSDLDAENRKQRERSDDLARRLRTLEAECSVRRKQIE